MIFKCHNTTMFKVESGVQMVARLTKKPNIENFYPNLFKEGPKQGHIIEVYSEDDTACLLCDIICELLMPSKLGGEESGVLVFNTDGKFDTDFILTVFKQKLSSRLTDLSLLNNIVQRSMSNLFVFNIYDATQLHASIQSMECILMNHPNVSLILFDSLTAFYWSQQSFKIMKMDMYLKYFLKVIQKVVQDYKVVTMYSRPQYFSSSKEKIENLDACSEYLTLDKVNYRIHVVFTADTIHHVTVQTHNELFKCSFKIFDNIIKWC